MTRSALTQELHQAGIRLQQQQVWQSASTGLLAGSACGCLLSLVNCMLQSPLSALWALALCLLGLCCGGAAALLRPVSLVDAARFLDRTQGLKDSLHSALQFSEERHDDPLRRLQIADAEHCLSQLNLPKAIPLQMPKYWKHGCLLSVCAVLMSLPAERPWMQSELTPSFPVVQNQTERLAEVFSELADFQPENSDPDLEILVAELNEQLQTMSKPGVQPEEAFAGLSEMNAALQEMQAKLQAKSSEARLQEIGAALSLSQSMAAAGESLASGDLERAAKELSELRLPNLDRVTKKAIAEKLRADDSDSSTSQKKSAVEKAAERMAEGLTEDDAQSFEDGARSLAEQSRQQAGRKKLAAMLKSQLQNLAEAKAELADAVRAKAPGAEKGGNQAGEGSDSSPVGSRLASGVARKELRLTGQNSGAGESEKETISETVQKQEAERAYRQLAEKHQSLGESAFETDSVPPGHRQIIRRYFDSIRPQEDATSPNQ